MPWWLVVYLAAAVVGARRLDASRLGYLTAYACEGSRLHFSCPGGQLIHVVRSNYGRFSIGTCNDNGTTGWSVDCTSHRSYYVVFQRCNTRSTCDIDASSDVFGDPCPGTYKYLEVQYQCLVDRSSTTSSTSTSPPSSTSGRPLIVVPRTIRIETTTTSTTTDMPTTTTTTTVPPPTSPTALAVESYRGYFPGGVSLCQARISRNIQWNWTLPGMSQTQPCPEGSRGVARWRCFGYEKQWSPEGPNLSGCRSLWVESLSSRLGRGEESAVRLAAELAVFSHSKHLYGGDLLRVADFCHHIVALVARKLRDLGGKRTQFLAELTELLVTSGSNIFSYQSAWADLQLEERKRVALRLIHALQLSAWMFAESHEGDFEFFKALPNIFYAVKTQVRYRSDMLIFPAPEEDSPWLQPYGETAEVSIHALHTAPTARAVFLSFRRLDELLAANETILSRVVAVYSGDRTNQRLVEPYVAVMSSGTGECAMWDETLLGWTRDQCRKLDSNGTHTRCQCGRFGLVALLAPDRSHGTHSPIRGSGDDAYKTYLTFIIAAAGLIFVVGLVFAVLFHFCRHRPSFTKGCKRPEEDQGLLLCTCPLALLNRSLPLCKCPSAVLDLREPGNPQTDWTMAAALQKIDIDPEQLLYTPKMVDNAAAAVIEMHGDI
ncbi:hypothetical protein LAZ67_12003045 [Cordylochernes scorpioides]|uniref:Latrophilin Cirl n=1 Tax=Cordylochernes scorpioides TaxID=51811 RepID=A0ABY6L270_9ARAC|nr:hypothetical protein LAZ67_12003045 [Cordylochernes scorpioides]